MSVYLTFCFYSNQPPSQRNGCKSYALKSVCSTACPRLHCTCCQQVFLLLGCVSLPNLPCCSNQLPNQKWVQVPCTKTVCSTVLVCQQVFSPLGCVSLPNLPCYSNQPRQPANGCTPLSVRETFETTSLCGCPLLFSLG